MEEMESGLLLMLYEPLFIENQPPVALAFEHINGRHRQWLGEYARLGGEPY